MKQLDDKRFQVSAEVAENYALQGCYTASSVDFLPMFQDVGKKLAA